jgi:hypothetical protein
MLRDLIYRRLFMLNIKTVVLFASLATLTACSGIRTSGNSFTTHAESFRILGIQIPENDQAKALSMVPAGAKIDTQTTTPTDWTSLYGALSNILWFGGTQISGTTSK